MHKSGTSLIAATLHASGIAMRDDNDPDPTVERASTRALNKAALAMADAHSLSIATPLSPARLQPQHRSAARRLLSALAAAPHLWDACLGALVASLAPGPPNGAARLLPLCPRQG